MKLWDILDRYPIVLKEIWVPCVKKGCKDWKNSNHQSSLTLKVSSAMAVQTIIKLGKFLKALEENSKMYVSLPMAIDVRDYLIVLDHPI